MWSGNRGILLPTITETHIFSIPKIHFDGGCYHDIVGWMNEANFFHGHAVEIEMLLFDDNKMKMAWNKQKENLIGCTGAGKR